MANQYLIICGSPRSGTSMLASHVNSLPDVALFAEFSLTRILRAADAVFNAMEDRQFAGFDPNALVQFRRPTLSEHFDGFMRDLWLQVYPGKNPVILGNKAPSLIALEDVGYLIDNIKHLQFIYIIRHCYDTVNSSRIASEASADFLVNDGSDAVWEWVYGLLLARYIAERDGRVLFVKYENLLADANSEAERIQRFLSVTGLEFRIAKPRAGAAASMPQALSSYPDELLGMIASWSILSSDEIRTWPLEATLDHISRQWQPLRQPYCDLGSVTNGYTPEPWGLWTKPGWFALAPRFRPHGSPLRGVEIVLEHPLPTLSGHSIKVETDGSQASIQLSDLGDGRTLMEAIFAAPIQFSPPHTDAAQIHCFSSLRFTFENDPRALGMAVSRYRMLY